MKFYDLRVDMEADPVTKYRYLLLRSCISLYFNVENRQEGRCAFTCRMASEMFAGQKR
jgi:hypothetical protein